jgi:hypothetical protein
MGKISFLLLIPALILSGCEKEDTQDVFGNELAKRAEKILSIKSTEQVYTDENNNEYVDITFDINKTSCTYGVYMLQGKKYNISVAGPNIQVMDFNLLKSDLDTLFFGEWNMMNQQKYIAWTSDVTDTFYVDLKYNENINFNTYVYRLTFEDLTTKELKWNDLNLLCSGDWLIDDKGNLTLACHQTSYRKWAKIVNDSLYNYHFSYNITNQSGIPDNFVGIACYAGNNVFDMFNMPVPCYNFFVDGPAFWSLEVWFENDGMGRDVGTTATNIKNGIGQWNNFSIETYGDSVRCLVNQENVYRFRNIHFMTNGLYIVIEDSKRDTVYLKDISLVRFTLP